MFEATKNSAGEERKAWYKNHNLPTLIRLWSGPRAQTLQCAVTGQPAFTRARCRVTGRDKWHFDCDFNHIRSEHNSYSRCGVSKDKTQAPSDLFRTYDLERCPKMLIEFVTMMPVTPTAHKHITTDGKYGHITLKNYRRSEWPWCLRTERNWLSTQRRFPCLAQISYAWIRDHLERIDHPPITARVREVKGVLVTED